MKTAFANYTRLAKSLLGISSLWMGEDHLVYVRGSGFIQSFSEEYLRYRYRDIQAFTITKTSRVGFAMLYLLGALIFGGTIGISLAVKGDSPIGPPMFIFLSIFSIITLVFLLLLLRHLILGPTCHCVIQTNLKKDRLRPLNRLHLATQCINALSKKLDQSQAELTTSRSKVASSTTTTPVENPANLMLKVPFLVGPTYIMFALLSIGIITSLLLESQVIVGVSMLLFAVASIGLVAALISSIRFATPSSIRSTLWVLLGMTFLSMGSGLVFYVYAAAVNPAYTVSAGGPLEALAGAESVGGLGVFLGFLTLSIITLVISIIGFISAIKWRKRIEKVSKEEEPAAQVFESE